MLGVSCADTNRLGLPNYSLCGKKGNLFGSFPGESPGLVDGYFDAAEKTAMRIESVYEDAEGLC
jgi:hypothetical protein